MAPRRRNVAWPEISKGLLLRRGRERGGWSTVQVAFATGQWHSGDVERVENEADPDPGDVHVYQRALEVLKDAARGPVRPGHDNSEIPF